MQRTKIEWTRTYFPDGTFKPGYTSNPIYAVDIATGKRGWYCTKISKGCANCYSEKINGRWGNGLDYTQANANKVEWVLNEKELALYAKAKPAKVFVGDMIDIFHEDVPDQYLHRLFESMLNSRLTFQILTKRPDRMRLFMRVFLGDTRNREILNKVWLGVSVENQEQDWRISELVMTPAKVRFISYEPVLGPLKLPVYSDRLFYPINQVIVGAESGNRARKMNQEWVIDIRDQCQELGVNLFYKQDAKKGKKISLPLLDGKQWIEFPNQKTSI